MQRILGSSNRWFSITIGQVRENRSSETPLQLFNKLLQGSNIIVSVTALAGAHEVEEDKTLILEDFLPYRLAILSHTVSSLIARVYDKRFGLTIPEWRVIAIVGRFPGLSAVEVAARTMLDKVAVSRAVTKLIKAGRIDREFADADRRRSILTLSEEGRAVHDEVAPLALEMEADLLHGLDDAQIDTLNIVIERLLARARLISSP